MKSEERVLHVLHADHMIAEVISSCQSLFMVTDSKQEKTTSMDTDLHLESASK